MKDLVRFTFRSLSRFDLGLMVILKNLYRPTGEMLMAICQQCISRDKYMLMVPNWFSVML